MPVYQLQESEQDTLPPATKSAISRAKTSWLKNTEVVDLLLNHQKYRLPVSSDPPNKPAGGTLYLFDKRQERYFRRDGHHWRKKANGKTVRETHEKLKVDNKDTLNCYYTHSEKADALQRRCYWLLDNEDGIVLVHYLVGSASRLKQATPQGSGSLHKHTSSSELLAYERSDRDDVDRGQGEDTRPLEAAQDRAAYGQALQAKKMNGDLIQPTAVHASFAYGPLFRAIDANEKLHRQRLQQMLANSVQAHEQEHLEREGYAADASPAPEEPAIEEGTPLSTRNTNGGAEMSVPAEHGRPDQSSLSDSRVPSEPGSDLNEIHAPKAKRQRVDQVGEAGNANLVHQVLDANREMLSQFKEREEGLLHHLQLQRQADEKFRRELMDFERERAKSERESLTTIATAIIGHLAGLHRPTHQEQAFESMNLGRFASPAASIPIGAFAHGVSLNGLHWPQQQQQQQDPSGR